MSRILVAFALGLAVSRASLAQQMEDGGPVPAGDPTLLAVGGDYYLFSSGQGAPILRSKDLLTWRHVGRVFETLPEWASAAVPESRGSVWAPDVVFLGGEYRVYWSTSTPGSRRSIIGYASNRSLDPGSPDYRWVDRGRVIETHPQDDWNAIDPQCFADRQGNVWLAMGSYWSGIKLRRLDAPSGLLSSKDTTLYSLAGRPDVDPPSIEGAYIMWRDGFYYLWVSFDRCNWGIHSNYNIRVGRSQEVKGPFVDRSGRAMLEGGGTLVLASHGTVRGPGHNSVLVDGPRTWIAHHYFLPAAGGARTLQVRPVYWDDEGWPLAGEPVGADSKRLDSPAGRWDYSIDFAEPISIVLNPDGTIDRPPVAATWKLEGDRLVLSWRRSGGAGRTPLRERCILAADGSWFVGRNPHGQIVRGHRTAE